MILTLGKYFCQLPSFKRGVITRINFGPEELPSYRIRGSITRLTWPGRVGKLRICRGVKRNIRKEGSVRYINTDRQGGFRQVDLTVKQY